MWIIIGTIVVLLLLLFAVYLNLPQGEQTEKKIFQLTAERDETELQLRSCLSLTVDQGMKLLGMQGGYYETPEPFENLAQYHVPYYYDGEFLVPPLSRVQDELCKYVESNLDYCMNYYKTLQEKGMSVGFKKNGCDAQFSPDSVSVDWKDQLQLKTKDGSAVIGEQKVTVATKFMKAHSFIQEMALDMVLVPSSFCMSCVSKKLQESNLQMHMERKKAGMMVFTLFDNQTIVQHFVVKP